MGQDNFSPQKQSSSGLPTTIATSTQATSAGRVLPLGRQIQETFNNIKITILCGFITILVLHGTIGVGNLGSSKADAVNQNLIE
ncbi:putative xyloglucan 6-xylosyltransferase [Rosa chinensis]|uniref:Putative xyloglucan 6-xylosyltransferase n=1 Tax=Rosa chinensis TaxID=74649 RepID=A0A2P6P7I0_ROSCH|nr:putative xyloglucan 6-xylosyltransferase [Rosa chinensis]